MAWSPTQKYFCVEKFISSGSIVEAPTSPLSSSPHIPPILTHILFLWGYLKDRVYVNNPRSIKDLKINITNEIGRIDHEMRRNVMKTLRKD